MGTRRVKFIGKTPYKKDNVCRTDLYWSHPGAICEAQEDVAVRLFAHPAVWVEADADDKGLPETVSTISKLSENLTREEKIEIAIRILIEEDGLAELNAYFGETIAITDGESSGKDAGSGIGNEDPVDLSDGLANVGSQGDDKKPPTATANFSADRNEAIIQAINLLDRDNTKEHFTKEGVPRVEVIEGLLGFDISAPERTAAWEEIQESEKA